MSLEIPVPRFPFFPYPTFCVSQESSDFPIVLRVVNPKAKLPYSNGCTVKPMPVKFSEQCLFFFPCPGYDL
jgi:hypothetical protein